MHSDTLKQPADNYPKVLVMTVTLFAQLVAICFLPRVALTSIHKEIAGFHWSFLPVCFFLRSGAPFMSACERSL